MKNILLPTDFSENSWNAIVYALNFFEQIPCNFYVLHVSRLSNVSVWEGTYIPAPEVIEEHYIKPSEIQLQKVLKKIKGLFKNNNHRFYTLADYDLFIDSIRKHVEEKNIDCIVMGTKGASGLKKLIVGSNTGDVITKVKCVTLAVPENATYKKPKEIAFPTDFSLFYHLNTLQSISEILETNNAAVRIVHVNKKGGDLNEDQVKNKEYLEDYFSNYEHSVHFLTNKHIEDAIQCFVESRDVNLIVMVAKNLNYFQQILFCPTVEKISYHTDVPFLVLHE